MNSNYIEGYSCIWLCSTLPSQLEEDVLYLVNTGTAIQVYFQATQAQGISLTQSQCDAFYALEGVPFFPAPGQPPIEIQWKQQHKLADAISLIVGYDLLEAFSRWGAQIGEKLRGLIATGTTTEAEDFLTTSLKTFTQRYKQLSLIYHPDKSTDAQKLAQEEKSKQLFHVRDTLKAQWEAIIRGEPQFSSKEEGLQRVHDLFVEQNRLLKIIIETHQALEKLTEELEADTSALRADTSALRADTSALRAEVEAYEQKETYKRKEINQLRAEIDKDYERLNIPKSEKLKEIERQLNELRADYYAHTGKHYGAEDDEEELLSNPPTIGEVPSLIEAERAPSFVSFQPILQQTEDAPVEMETPREASPHVPTAPVEEDTEDYTRPRTDDWYLFQQEVKHFIEMLNAFKEYLACLLEDIKAYFQSSPTEATIAKNNYPSRQSLFPPVPEVGQQPEFENDEGIQNSC